VSTLQQINAKHLWRMNDTRNPKLASEWIQPDRQKNRSSTRKNMQIATKWQNKPGMSHKMLLLHTVTRSLTTLQCALSPFTQLLSTCSISPRLTGLCKPTHLLRPVSTDSSDGKRMVGKWTFGGPGRRRGGGTKCIVNKQVGKAWNGLIWLRTGQATSSC